MTLRGWAVSWWPVCGAAARGSAPDPAPQAPAGLGLPRCSGVCPVRVGEPLRGISSARALSPVKMWRPWLRARPVGTPRSVPTPLGHGSASRAGACGVGARRRVPAGRARNLGRISRSRGSVREPRRHSGGTPPHTRHPGQDPTTPAHPTPRLGKIQPLRRLRSGVWGGAPGGSAQPGLSHTHGPRQGRGSPRPGLGPVHPRGSEMAWRELHAPPGSRMLCRQNRRPRGKAGPRGQRLDGRRYRYQYPYPRIVRVQRR
ncbi:hypothetical protein KPP03845_103011 [Streptomyces xanthophaeus]|nr:hypothetical protein KPP03845_103011 [Streptomyces xanthophaeus]